MKKNKENLEKIKKDLIKIAPPNLDYFLDIIIPEYYPRMGKTISMIEFADKVFSDFIRITNANDYGMVQCITCGNRFFREDGMKINNGHYKKRSSYKYRFHLQNCHPQCYTCNVALSGNYRQYYLYMIETYGEETERKIREDKGTMKIYDYDLVQRCKDRHTTILEKKAIIEKNNPEKLRIKP